jgi:TetR/AcrR family transcriptional repressor of nem operon
MMGTLVMSRVAGSGELSDEILASGREAALARAEGTKSVAKKARAKPN